MSTTDIPMAAPPIKKLDDLDRVRMENLQLRYENLRLRKDLLALQSQILDHESQTLTSTLSDARTEIGRKYDVDPAGLRIRQDGVIEQANGA